MHNPIENVLHDGMLSVDEKARQLTHALGSMPDKGVPQALSFLFATNDPAAASFVANYLTLLPGLQQEKVRVVRHFVCERKQMTIAAVRLIRDIPLPVVDEIVTQYLSDPSVPGMDSVIYEVAMFFPSQLHRFADRISDEEIREAMLPGGADEWVAELVKRYCIDRDPTHLRTLSRFHTDYAISAMIDLWPTVSEEDRWSLYAYIESSGVFPDSREASVYSKTFRGRVVDLASSPHEMGGEFSGGVPACVICERPANRIVTLKRNHLGIEIPGTRDPTFFWIDCPHPQDYVIARITDHGAEGIMTKTVYGSASTDLVPGSAALQLEEHPNQHGYGMDVVPGYGLHQVGGYPPWVRIDHFPRCPGCKQGMRYLTSVDSGMTYLGELHLGGMLHGFWCERCAISTTLLQSF